MNSNSAISVMPSVISYSSSVIDTQNTVFENDQINAPHDTYAIKMTLLVVSKPISVMHVSPVQTICNDAYDTYDTSLHPTHMRTHAPVQRLHGVPNIRHKCHPVMGTS